MKCYLFIARRRLKVQVPCSISIGVKGGGLDVLLGRGGSSSSQPGLYQYLYGWFPLTVSPLGGDKCPESPLDLLGHRRKPLGGASLLSHGAGSLGSLGGLH